MRRRFAVLSRLMVPGLLVVVAAYAIAPYVTLWRLYEAMREGDVRTLAGLVDWESVRAGVKQDIAEGVIGMPATQLVASNGLPPFGASFVSGIAAGVVDRELTPEHVEETVQAMQNADTLEPGEAPPSRPMHGIEHAFFESTSAFMLRLRPPGCDAEDPPVRVRMELHTGGWRVVRVWVPQEIVERMKSRT